LAINSFVNFLKNNNDPITEEDNLFSFVRSTIKEIRKMEAEKNEENNSNFNANDRMDETSIVVHEDGGTSVMIKEDNENSICRILRP
jgi:uncharacterized damage-inducible protein DinB